MLDKANLDLNGLVEQARALVPNVIGQFQAIVDLFKGLGMNDAEIKAELAQLTAKVKEFEVTF